MANETLQMIVIPAVAIPLTLVFLKLKNGSAKAFMNNYIEENDLDAEVIKVGIPPIRLWFRNRKSDSWVKVRCSDGEVLWARIRRRLISGGDPVEFFN